MLYTVTLKIKCIGIVIKPFCILQCINVGQFLIINKVARKKIKKPVFMCVLSIIVWSLASALSVPILYATTVNATNILILSFLAAFYVICFVVS